MTNRSSESVPESRSAPVGNDMPPNKDVEPGKENDPRTNFPSSTVHRVKAVGLAGWVMTLLSLAVIVFALGAAGGGHAAAPWLGGAAVLCAVMAAALIAGSRRLMLMRPVGERPQQDPIQPETTSEEAELYEQRFHAGDAR